MQPRRALSLELSKIQLSSTKAVPGMDCAMFSLTTSPLIGTGMGIGCAVVPLSARGDALRAGRNIMR